MNLKPVVLASLAGLTLVSLLATTASAHATFYTPDNKIRFTYGHLGEPIFTFQKTGLDLTIRDNATGAALPGYEMPAGANAVPRLFVSYRYGETGTQELNITTKFVSQHGQPGKYTYPIMFTQPGLYYLLVKGTINGTHYDLVIPPAHEVPSTDQIMWPQTVDTDATQAAKIAALEKQVQELKANGGSGEGTSPGLDGLVVVGVLAAAGVLLRRRR